jgi:FxsC-like protein
MPTHWFFFSYARDQDSLNPAQRQASSPGSYQEQFFDDLVKEIHRRYGHPPQDEKAGFIDVDIPTGQIWRDRLAEALNTCRCFVFLQEPNYFQREWCGKEWQVFLSRIESFLKGRPAGTERPPLMIPVLWVPIEVALPPSATEIQDHHRTLGNDYANVGVLDLMRLGKHRDAYTEFLCSLAKLIYKVSHDHSLPLLDTVPPFEDVLNIFRPDPAPGPHPMVQPALGSPGPKRGYPCAQFVYVVASRDEVENQNIRKLIEAYGNEADDWMPYYPATKDPAYYLAQTAATNRKFKYEKLPLGPDLIDKLVEAKEVRKIVVLFVDCWSLKVGNYKHVVADYMERNFWNSLVIVPWNEDEETHENAKDLQSLLEETFFGLSEDIKRFRVVSYDRFLPELDTALHDRLGAILRAPETTFRQVLGNGPRVKPVLSAVRGG